MVYLPFNPTQVTSPQNGNNPKWGDPCHTLAATDYAPHVAFRQNASGDVFLHGGDGSTTGSLTSSSSTYSRQYHVVSGYVVRRLMPVECERLQGFPDGWTDIEVGEKPASDTARYKALGNSMPVPVMLWIGRRIEEADLFGSVTEVP